MSQTLRNVGIVLPAILRDAIPKPSQQGYILELDRIEYEALRELSQKLQRKRSYETPPVNG